jgi:hypothetical protein
MFRSLSRLKAPGVVAYAAMLLWFLLTAGAPRVSAADTVAARAADLVPLLRDALVERGVKAPGDISLADPDAAFFIAQGVSPFVESIDIDPQTGRFIAKVLADGAALIVEGVAQTPARRAERVVLVKKGATVAMVFEAGGLKATHMGLAQQSGAMGDLVDVKNIKSGHIVKAVVAGENVLLVASPRNAAFAALEQNR